MFVLLDIVDSSFLLKKSWVFKILVLYGLGQLIGFSYKNLYVSYLPLFFIFELIETHLKLFVTIFKELLMS